MCASRARAICIRYALENTATMDYSFPMLHLVARDAPSFENSEQLFSRLPSPLFPTRVGEQPGRPGTNCQIEKEGRPFLCLFFFSYSSSRTDAVVADTVASNAVSVATYAAVAWDIFFSLVLPRRLQNLLSVHKKREEAWCYRRNIGERRRLRASILWFSR